MWENECVVQFVVQRMEDRVKQMGGEFHAGQLLLISSLSSLESVE